MVVGLVLAACAAAPVGAEAAATVSFRLEPRATDDPNTVLIQRVAPRKAGASYTYLANFRLHARNLGDAPGQIKKWELTSDIQSGSIICTCPIDVPSGESSTTLRHTSKWDAVPTAVTFRATLADGTVRTLTYGVRLHRHPTRSGAYRMPGRASDLGTGVFWGVHRNHDTDSHHHDTVSQMYAYDFLGWRWDGQEWVTTTTAGADGKDNEDYLIWNKPAYAMADGVVLACKRTVTDNTTLGTAPGGGGGNHLYVDHGGGEVALYAHFRKDTVPTAVCPRETVTAAEAKETGWRVLPQEAERVVIREGQLLGRIGNTGNSTHPHLHLHLQRGYPSTEETTSLPLQFDRFESRKFWEPPDRWNPATAPGFASVGIEQRSAGVDWGVFLPNPCGWDPPAGGLTAYSRAGVPRECYYEMVDEAAARGYVPVAVDGFEVAGKPLFNLVFGRDTGSDLYAFTALTLAEFDQKFASFVTRDGYRMLHLDSYRRYGQTRYTAVFRRQGGPAWLVYRNMSKTLFEDRNGRLLADGYRPTVLSVVEEDGAPRFSAIYELRDVGGILVRAGVAEADLQTVFNTYTGWGYKPTYLDAYREGGVNKFATVWTTGASSDYVMRFNLSPLGAEIWEDSSLSAGRSTKVVTGYDSGGKPRLAAVWRGP